jgi:hypothetical protein
LAQASKHLITPAAQSVSGKRLEWAILTFLGLALLSLVVVYLIEASGDPCDPAATGRSAS